MSAFLHCPIFNGKVYGEHSEQNEHRRRSLVCLSPRSTHTCCVRVSSLAPPPTIKLKDNRHALASVTPLTASIFLMKRLKVVKWINIIVTLPSFRLFLLSRSLFFIGNKTRKSHQSKALEGGEQKKRGGKSFFHNFPIVIIHLLCSTAYSSRFVLFTYLCFHSGGLW